MDKQTAVAEPAVESGSEQSGYIDDALSSQQQEPQTEDTQAQTPKEPNTQEQPETSQQTQQQQAATPDPIDALFQNEQGEFDSNSFNAFSLPDSILKVEQQQDAQTQQPEQEDTRPAWKKDLDDIRDYEKNLKSQALEPIEKAYAEIQAGADPLQVLQNIYNERLGVFNEHMEEYRYQRQSEREEARMKSESDAGALASMKSKATANVNELVSALPGNDSVAKTKLFSHVLFGKDIGAPILNREFMRRYPEAGKMSQQESEKLADKFIAEIQSDKSELRYFWDLCWQKANWLKKAEIAQQNRLAGAVQEKERRQAAQKHPAGPYKRQQAPSQSKDPWDSYFNMADRV